MDDGFEHLLLEHQMRIHDILQEWMNQQREMHESLALAQKQSIQKLVITHQETMNQITGVKHDYSEAQQGIKQKKRIEEIGDLSTGNQVASSSPWLGKEQSLNSHGRHPNDTKQNGHIEEIDDDPSTENQAASSSLPGVVQSSNIRGRPPDASLECSSVLPVQDPSSAEPTLQGRGSLLSSALFGVEDSLHQSSELNDAHEDTDALVGKRCDMDQEVLDMWRQCSGLFTVERSVTNYRNHPSGWTALLMIHGVDKICGRLQKKVENYCIYSALFLSISFTGLCAPSDFFLESRQGSATEWTETRWRERVYVYTFLVGSASHLLCIFLGMSFVNAVNETARDSDVYRMFARGQGFQTTVKCQAAFRIGCFSDFIAVGVACTFLVSWIEVVALFTLMGIVCCRIFWKTASLLFESASIVKYWRPELGGKPDPGDTYDLSIAVNAFQRRAGLEKHFLKRQTLMRKEDSERPATDSKLNKLPLQKTLTAGGLAILTDC
eukprot:TRINITY_DN18403_c0_g2_i1.p1 TRINITY_DN18403_c0_g2~~TRINITY_DN18403_c0_g2_i1.p1  ORF type:complete len:494 (-),score=82.75 TRINITY_DN18403_c0_g2_i1:55-1536(-)